MPVIDIRPHLCRPSAVAGVAVCAALMLAGLSFADDRASGREDTTVSAVGQLVADDTLDPRIVALELTGASWDASVAQLDAVLFEREEATRRKDVAETALAQTRAGLRDTARMLGEAKRRARVLDEQIARHVVALQERALALFIGFGDDDELDGLQSFEEASEGARQRQLADEVDEHQLDLLSELERQADAVETQLSDLEARLVALRANQASLVKTRDAAVSDLDAADTALSPAIVAVREARRRATIPGLDISVVALDAYLTAETSLRTTLPACAISWWMIAGVGRVESRHGELGGRSVRADGRPSRAIIGIALDGSPGVRAIADTDGGTLDGDGSWDRAVGPMQFIPTTWRIRGRDGNGDGVADPHNLYDAALASGTYLCRLGGDLSSRERLREAYFGYNTSSDYVDLVESFADRYRAFELPTVGAAGPETVDGTGENTADAGDDR